MNHWQKLGLPVALGICAAYLNWQSVSSKLEPRDYVAVSEDIDPGKILTKESLIRVSISSSSPAALDITLVPWSQVDALTNRYAHRKLLAKSPLTQFDIAEVNLAEKEDSEDEISVTMSVSEKESRLIFVNDWVNTRDQSGKELNGCRVLSIIRGKDNYIIQLAVDAARLRKFNPAWKSDSTFTIYGRYVPGK